jgi:hypothetical protein
MKPDRIAMVGWTLQLIPPRVVDEDELPERHTVTDAIACAIRRAPASPAASGVGPT